MALITKIIQKAVEKRPRCAAVIPAAGSSSRMGGMNKLLYELGGIPVLVRTLNVFEACSQIDEIIVVTREQEVESITELCSKYALHKVKQVVAGGATRTESVLNGVRATGKETDLIAIHDAARPFITERVISECISAAKTYHAAAPAVPVKDTIKQANGGIVEKTLDRARLAAIQTPQVFAKELILSALTDAQRENISLTDDCAAVEQLGMSVFLTKGDYYNIKITTQEDLVFAKAILELEERL